MFFPTETPTSFLEENRGDLSTANADNYACLNPCSLYRGLYVGGLYRGYIGITEKKMETTIMDLWAIKGYIGYPRLSTTCQGVFGTYLQS